MTARLRARRRESGAAAVEFALVVVLLLALLFGVIQYGMYFYSAQTGSSAAREAARRVTVGDCPAQSDLNQFVLNRLGGAASATPTVTRVYTKNNGTTTSAPAEAEVGGTVKLTVSFASHNFHFPFVPFLSDATIVREVDARMEDITPSGSCT